MSDSNGQTPSERFLAATELADTGIAIKRQNLRRRYPDAADAVIDDLLRSWLQDRPMDYAPMGREVS